jgi:hypothetical protein
MKTVQVTRYITPLREGGSMPAIVEGSDDGMYVLKFRGAGQGTKALIAELIAGEIARKLDLPIPDIVLMDLDPALADTEPDPEIQDLVRASAGTNLALDYLPGSFAFDPAAFPVDTALASAILWFDGLVCNMDRTRRNTNLLVWHRKLYLIDHGAALYFHHAPSPISSRARDRFPQIKDHVLLAHASAVADLDKELSERIDARFIENTVADIPEGWLSEHPGEAQRLREEYTRYFCDRLQFPRPFVLEAVEAYDRLA